MIQPKMSQLVLNTQAHPSHRVSTVSHFYTLSVFIVSISIRRDSMISLGGHGENRGSNLMGNKYNICTFSLITIPDNAPVSRSMMIDVKQCMMHEIFFVFQW
jgi:hypothetical protein